MSHYIYSGTSRHLTYIGYLFAQLVALSGEILFQLHLSRIFVFARLPPPCQPSTNGRAAD